MPQTRAVLDAYAAFEPSERGNTQRLPRAVLRGHDF
jgi:hypothetical protein